MRYAIVILLITIATPAAAQTRASQIASEFSKTRSTTKSKHGMTTHKYKEVRSAPWLTELRNYAGHYVSLGNPLELTVSVSANGVVTASGRDEARFEVRTARIEDAMLYGTKVYRSGRSEAFEAAFLKRSHRDAPDKNFTLGYGVAVLIDAPPPDGVSGLTHVFLEKE